MGYGNVSNMATQHCHFSSIFFFFLMPFSYKRFHFVHFIVWTGVPWLLSLLPNIFIDSIYGILAIYINTKAKLQEVIFLCLFLRSGVEFIIRCLRLPQKVKCRGGLGIFLQFCRETHLNLPLSYIRLRGGCAGKYVYGILVFRGSEVFFMVDAFWLLNPFYPCYNNIY